MRFAHWLSHLIVWRSCDCHTIDHGQSARLDAYAVQWAEMNDTQRREAFGALRRSL